MEHLPLWNKEEYTYPVFGRFVPHLTPYLHADAQLRPAIIVVPGGAYCYASATEAAPVAEAFYAKGYQAFVLAYTTNPGCYGAPVRWQALNDLARAVRMVRENADVWHVDAHKVVPCGFSAGGHLAASLAVHWARPEVAPGATSCRPDAVLLGYPVIDFGQYTHEMTREALLGPQFTPQEAELMSLEKQVKSETAPVFLWHTRDDASVPVENSLLFAEALRAQGVVHELHIFADGMHGMALADEAWARDDVGERYSEQQLTEMVRYVIENHTGQNDVVNGYDLSQFSTLEEFLHTRASDTPARCMARKKNDSVALWPTMADLFLRRLWGA